MRNRNKADIALIIVLLLSIPSIILKLLYKESFILNLVSFSIEASLIGSIADWFAVTALFKKPLGFSWHTAIIPRSRDRMADSISLLVEEELLGSDELLRKIHSIETAQFAKSALAGIIRPDRLKLAIQAYLDDKISTFDLHDAAWNIQQYIRNNIVNADLSANMHLWLNKALTENKHIEWTASALAKLKNNLSDKKINTAIFKVLRKTIRTSGSSGSFLTKGFLSLVRRGQHINLGVLADIIQQELVILASEMSDPDNPLTLKISSKLEDVIAHELEAGNALMEINEWKDKIGSTLDIQGDIEAMLSTIISSDGARLEAVDWLSTQIVDNISHFLDQSASDEPIESLIKNAASAIIASEHHAIGEMVRDSLSAFSDESFAKFIEDKVGDDLQWIRINGTIVGGAVGVIIFLIMELFYSPIVVPFICKLTGI